MGLKEKRAVQDFEQNIFPGLKTEIETIAGFSIEFEIAWEKLAIDGYDHLYAEAFPKVYFTPIANAFKEICVDDMGKEALKGALKKIFITNEKGASSPTAMAFEGGTLTVDHKPATNIDDIDVRSKAIQKLLENAL